MALPLLGLGMLALRGVAAVARVARALPAAGRALGGIGRATARAGGAVLRGGFVVAKTLGRGVATTARVIGRTVKVIRKAGVVAGSFLAGRNSRGRNNRDERDRRSTEDDPSERVGNPAPNGQGTTNGSAGGAEAAPVVISGDEPEEDKSAKERLADIRRQKREVIFSMIKRVVAGEGGNGVEGSRGGRLGGRLNLSPFLDELRRLRESETSAKAAAANETAKNRADKVAWRVRVSNFMKFIMNNLKDRAKALPGQMWKDTDRQGKIGLLLLAGGLLTKFVMWSWEKLSGMLDSVTKSLQETWDGISSKFAEIKDNIVGQFTSTMTGISEWWDELSIKDMAEGVWGTTKEFFSGVKSSVTAMIGKWSSVVDWIKDSWLGKLFSSLSDSIGKFTADFKGFVQSWADTIFGGNSKEAERGEEAIDKNGDRVRPTEEQVQETPTIGLTRPENNHNTTATDSEVENQPFSGPNAEEIYSDPTDPKKYEVPHEVSPEEPFDHEYSDYSPEEKAELIRNQSEKPSERLNIEIKYNEAPTVDPVAAESLASQLEQEPAVDRMAQKKDEVLKTAEVVRKDNEAEEGLPSFNNLIHHAVADHYKDQLIKFEEKLLNAKDEEEAKRIEGTIEELKRRIKHIQGDTLAQSIPPSLDFVPDDIYTHSQPMFASTDTAAMNAAVPRGFSNSKGKRYSPEVEDAIISAHQQTGVSEDFLRSMAFIESGGRANAVSGTGATGLFQFTEGTGRAYGLVGPGFDNRKNAKANAIAAAKLAQDNKKSLQRLFKKFGINREVTDFDLYMAHQQGAGGWTHILRRAESGESVSPQIRKNMNNNAGKGLNASQFVKHWEKSFGEKVATSGFSVSGGNIGGGAVPQPPTDSSGGIESTEIDPSTGLSPVDAGEAGVNEVSGGIMVNPDEVIKSDLAGKIRRRPITDALKKNVAEAVVAVYGEGSRATLYSGGQAALGSGENRVGSTRHDLGRAGDFYIYGPDGKQIKGDELGKLAQYWLAANKGGVGLEMRGGGIHLDEHLNRTRFWNYVKDGGSFTKGQRSAVALGKKGVMPELRAQVAGVKAGGTSVGNASNFEPTSSGTSSALSDSGSFSSAASSAASALSKMTGENFDSSSLSSLTDIESNIPTDISGVSSFLKMMGLSDEEISSFQGGMSELKSSMGKFFSGNSSDIQFNTKKYFGDWREADAEYLASVGKSQPEVVTTERTSSSTSMRAKLSGLNSIPEEHRAVFEGMIRPNALSALQPLGAENMNKIAGILEEDTSSVDAIKNMTLGMLAMPTPVPPRPSSSQDYSTGGGFNRYTAPMITRCTDSAIRRVADAFMAYGMP